MNRWLPFVIIALVAVLALGAGTYWYRANVQHVANLTQAQVAAAAKSAVHVRGSSKAQVTIEEFGDFQCPPCGKLSEPLNQTVHDFGKQVQLVFREFPLTIHQNAQAAARAVESAGLQGRFWEMHDLLYREQEVWSKATPPDGLFAGYAKLIGLDLEKFRAGITSEAVTARLAADKSRADKLGVSLTPTVYMNGKILKGPSLGVKGLRAAVEEALAQPATR